MSSPLPLGIELDANGTACHERLELKNGPDTQISELPDVVPDFAARALVSGVS